MTPRSRRGDASGLLLALLAACLLAAGCQSAPPAPADRYYRLPELPAQDRVVRPWTRTGSIEIRELRADGPYLERAILFTSGGQTTHIESYNYDHWIYPPPYLIQQHMVRWFRQNRVAPTIVDDDRGARPAFVVSGKIVRFEQTVEAAAVRADVELELEVASSAQGSAVSRRTYRMAEPATGTSMDAFVLSMSRALERIYAELSNDVTATQD
jgi:ABC-type uncharacterized transport system auxiliary subunit